MVRHAETTLPTLAQQQLSGSPAHAGQQLLERHACGATFSDPSVPRPAGLASSGAEGVRSTGVAGEEGVRSTGVAGQEGQEAAVQVECDDPLKDDDDGADADELRRGVEYDWGDEDVDVEADDPHSPLAWREEEEEEEEVVAVAEEDGGRKKGSGEQGQGTGGESGGEWLLEEGLAATAGATKQAKRRWTKRSQAEILAAAASEAYGPLPTDEANGQDPLGR